VLRLKGQYKNFAIRR